MVLVLQACVHYVSIGPGEGRAERASPMPGSTGSWPWSLVFVLFFGFLFVCLVPAVLVEYHFQPWRAWADWGAWRLKDCVTIAQDCIGANPRLKWLGARQGVH